MAEDDALKTARQAVLAKSKELAGESLVIRGHDFNASNSIEDVLSSMLSTGCQASHLGKAIREVQRMLDWRLSHEAITSQTDDRYLDPGIRAGIKTKIFLAYTSNLVSSGVREHIRFLAQHRMIDVLVTSAGGVEEDLIKCLGDTYLGDFKLKGAQLRSNGINRIGNMLVPNANYCAFEDWIMPILDILLKEQEEDNIIWTPSKIIDRLGREINHPDSICYWAHKHHIPIYCPALTDGSIGDMLYFHSYKNPGLVCDIIGDIRSMNNEAVRASPRKTGIIILGGGLSNILMSLLKSDSGVSKHHVCNANMMRNGADFAVYINTAQEYDGSDSGASPDEAVSWGKIRAEATPVKVVGDATILFPLLISQTFAKGPIDAIE